MPERFAWTKYQPCTGNWHPVAWSCFISCGPFYTKNKNIDFNRPLQLSASDTILAESFSFYSKTHRIRSLLLLTFPKRHTLCICPAARSSERFSVAATFPRGTLWGGIFWSQRISSLTVTFKKSLNAIRVLTLFYILNSFARSVRFICYLIAVWICTFRKAFSGQKTSQWFSIGLPRHWCEG